MRTACSYLERETEGVCGCVRKSHTQRGEEGGGEGSVSSVSSVEGVGVIE